ncbi:hypothetical protein [Maridesulfovibrio hydrothermalis]|uniref:Uncharacterized protein n=1 Tax=Maridesulfovibrio hydrothermalis AM13 = DSM 14728 TaxID=1121451 RepID=L0RB89_9BACT|nr:hypothetical protein [Maridesulfovibrio hydrothermalis]CCO23482.1 conserved protein of unknown function [Maridesulfovibrio hydrothermalis AM13 = DSM 14728]
MEHNEIKRIFEAYFEKYKKTEGDRSSWSTVWLENTPAGVLELNMTKCPRGTTFKIFVNKKKEAQVLGWDAFFTTMEEISQKHPSLYDKDKIFSEMEFVI